ncbi:MAG TPA: hypothetical protein DC064_10350 [Cyanobacteria bacterium UBA9273]|nr:hypothetical protein [Cyanobacteria bacterium UBA9273]
MWLYSCWGIGNGEWGMGNGEWELVIFNTEGTEKFNLPHLLLIQRLRKKLFPFPLRLCSG